MKHKACSVEEGTTSYEFELTYSVTVTLPGEGDEEMAKDGAKKLVQDGQATLLKIE